MRGMQNHKKWVSSMLNKSQLRIVARKEIRHSTQVEKGKIYYKLSSIIKVGCININNVSTVRTEIQFQW